MSTFSTCTSSTRPGSPTDGDVLFETDTKNVIIWDGTNWRGYQYDLSFGWNGSNLYSVDFDGIDYHATLGTNTLFNSGSAFSVSFWITLDTYAATNYPYIFSFKSNLTQPFIIGASNQSNYAGIYFGMPTNTIDLSTNSTSISSALLTDWHHICITYNGSGVGTDSNYKLYYDGSLQTLSAPGGFSSVSNESYFARSSNGGYLNGKLDEISIYSSELRSSNVTSIYNSGVAGVDLSSFSPLGWWRMGDNSNGTGTTITDQGSGGNHATLVNGPTFSTSVPS